MFLPYVQGNPQQDLEEKGVIDSGCSRHMTGNMSYLTDFKEIDEGYVAFGGNPKGGEITGRCTIKTGNLDFENVYFVRELQFNLFSVSQMCDKKNSVLFNDTECIVLSPNFKLSDKIHVLLKVPRNNNMYSVDLKNVVPKGGLTCLFVKATSDESKLWNRRLGHINFKTLNKLVKGNLVRGLPSKLFENDQTCVACQKGKQHRASSERKNRTLIETARTMLADSKLPTTFWAEAVNTACYVQNRVLVTKPHNKTPYELFLGRKPALGFIRPFGCPVTILNTIDHLGKFDGKADEGFFVGYSINRSGPNWLFDINALTKSMNYKPVIAGNQSNGNAGTKACDDAGKAKMETVPGKDYILLPLWPADPLFSQCSKSSPDAGFKPSGDDEKKITEEPGKEGGDPSKEDQSNDQEKDDNVNNTNNVNAVSTNKVNVVGRKSSIERPDDPNMPKLEDIIYLDDDDDDVGAEADMNNLDAFMPVNPIPTTRIHKDHPNKARLVAQGYTQEEWIDYDEVFACVARIKAIWLFLAYATFKDFVVYQMDVKSAFLHDKIEEEVYVCQLPGFEDPDFPDRVYKVEKALYGLHQAPRAWYETLSTYLLDNRFQRGKIDKTLFIRRTSFTDVKIASTPMETQKPLLKDEDGEEVDVHLYRSMIGSLMYLTYLRPDIMFAVCACARYQVNPKVSHHVVKRIFRYLKGQPKLGLWYPKDSPFDFVAYTDCDYAGASLDRKSTTRGCQFLGSRLISWQCKKQTVVANSKTEAEYVAASSCCSQVIWIQNQLLDYGDSNEKKLIQMIKIHTDKNVADLLTKAFDNGIGVNVGDSKLMLLGINLLLLGKVNAARHNLQLLVNVNAVEGSFINTSIKKLIRMDAKTTALNEFSSTMTSTIICLATNQKFNFLKYIFESMVKNLDNAGKFLMYPRFIQVFLDNQLEGMSSHKRIYITPSHTKKIFANMRRQGKDFSEMETPLFPTMVVQAQEEMGEGSTMPTDPHHTPIITQPSSSQPQRKQKSTRSKRKDTEVPQTSDPTNVADETVNEEPCMQLKELMDFCTKLQQRVLDLENTKTAQAQKITSLKLRVKKLEKKGGSRTHKLKRLYKAGRSARIVSFDEASLSDQEDASKQGRKIHDIDADEDITLENIHDDDIMFDVSDLVGEEVFVAEQGVLVKKKNDVAQVNTASLKSAKPTTTASTRPKAKRLVIYEEEQATTPIVSSQQPSQVKVQDKGKGILVEEPVKSIKKTDQIRLDEELVFKLQAKEEEEKNLQGKTLKPILQAEEQKELIVDEKATLFQ
ncbi:putative ribonuclease H-like domain-containing protein [Tanacetum coccineum]